MAETTTTPPSEGADELRGKLVKRLAVAGVLVAVLLAILAFFDRLATPDEPEPEVFSKPVPVAPKKEVTQPVTTAVNPPEPPPPEPEVAKPEESTPAKASEKSADFSEALFHGKGS